MQDFIAERKEKEQKLIERLKERETEIRQLQQQVENWHASPDGIYRFYHHSYKVFSLNHYTEQIVSFFTELMDIERKDLHPWFVEICEEGLGRSFTQEANSNWLNETRPVMEAFFHAKHLLDMMIVYGLDKDAKEREGFGGWFSVLYLYQIR